MRGAVSSDFRKPVEVSGASEGVYVRFGRKA